MTRNGIRAATQQAFKERAGHCTFSVPSLSQVGRTVRGPSVCGDLSTHHCEEQLLGAGEGWPPGSVTSLLPARSLSVSLRIYFLICKTGYTSIYPGLHPTHVLSFFSALKE